MARKSRKQEMEVPILQEAKLKEVYFCGIYGRLSLVNSGKQDHGESIENQQSICRQFIDGKENLKLTDTYIDNGRKGTTFQRPEFNRMMEDVKTGKINCIVVKDLSRFGRDYLEAGEYLEKIFPFMGVRFISVTDGYDSLHSSMDEKTMMIPLKNMINELYAKDLSQKICTSIHARMEKGEFLPGRLCYGYIRSEEDEFTLVPDPVTADYVKLIFELRRAGKSYEAIRKHLDEIHAITPSQRKAQLEVKNSKQKVSDYWYATSVSDILSNPVYLGHLVHGKEPKALYRGQRYRQEVSRSEWKVYENMHQPIIDQELYDVVQKINQKTKAKYQTAHQNDHKNVNIYRDIIRCGDCGNGMQHGFSKSKTKKTPVFRCGRYKSTSRRECSIHTIKESVVHDTVLAHIKFHIKNFADSDISIEKEITKTGTMGDTIRNQIAGLAKKKTRVAMLRGSLYENYSEGILSETEYLEMKETYISQERELQCQMEYMSERKAEIENCISEIGSMTGAYQKFSKRKKLDRSMLECLVKEIRIYENNRIEVIFKFSETYNTLRKLEGMIIDEM